MDCNCNNRYHSRQGRYPGRQAGQRQAETLQIPVRRAEPCGCAGQAGPAPVKPPCAGAEKRSAAECKKQPAAMAYVPWQKWGDIYQLCQGLQAGTIFPELDKPFLCGRCCR